MCTVNCYRRSFWVCLVLLMMGQVLIAASITEAKKDTLPKNLIAIGSSMLAPNQFIACIDNPIISCPPDFEACPGTPVDPSVSGQAIAVPGGPDCNPPILTYNDLSLTLGPCVGQRLLQRTWTATDPDDPSLENSCIQMINLIDNDPPILPAIPMDVTVDCLADLPAPAKLTALDLCAGNITMLPTETTVGGNCPDSMLIIREWVFVDNCGNEASASQTILIDDQAGPIFNNCPADMTITFNANCIATATWPAVTAQDNCGANVTLSASHAPGDTFPDGITDVTYTAEDICGNTNTCTFTITVGGQCCQDPPVITCPPDFVGCPGSDTSPSTTGQATAVTGSSYCMFPLITLHRHFYPIFTLCGCSRF